CTVTRRRCRCSTPSARAARGCAAGAKAISVAGRASEAARLTSPGMQIIARRANHFDEEQAVMHHTKRSARIRVVALLVGALFILNAATPADGQSGRRIPKR